ncbi:MAG TPA: hypothetical protein VJK29_17560 [Terriglobales bacterium]|nr:hypothetical protein [Terriglobales bacterium]
MGSLLVAFVVSLTVFSVVVLGILAAYGAVTGILYAFAHQSRRATSGTRVLVPSQTHAGGD